MPAPAWVRVRASDSLPADIAVDVANGKTWDGTTEVTTGITGVLNIIPPGGGFNGGYAVSGFLQTFFRRAARTYVIQTLGGDNIPTTEILVSGDTWTFDFSSLNSTHINATNAVADASATLGSGSWQAGNTVYQAFTGGASGCRVCGNNGTVASVTDTQTPGASDVFNMMQSHFGDSQHQSTLVTIFGWNDADRIAAADLAALTLPIATSVSDVIIRPGLRVNHLLTR